MATYFHIANLSIYLLWNMFCKIFISENIPRSYNYQYPGTIITTKKTPSRWVLDTNHCRFMKKDWIFKTCLSICLYIWVHSKLTLIKLLGFASESSLVSYVTMNSNMYPCEFLNFHRKKSAHLYNSHIHRNLAEC